jgi:RNA polymerase sigma factor (sigma-70 family)
MIAQAPAQGPVIHVVDDDPSFRRAISRLLTASGYSVVAYQSAAEFLVRPIADGPGCLVLDVHMPGFTGTELQTHLSASGNSLPIVFLTGQGDIPTSVQAIKAGADDFLTKPVPKKVLLDSIERAISRHEKQRQDGARIVKLQALLKSLTPREHEVFIRMVSGKLNKQIAHELGISERTVKAHRHAVMEKLEVQSLAAAVVLAERLGILS